MADSPLLEVRDVHKHFAAIQVLRGVNMTVRAGEVTALVGDNGAGKSTLIKCLAGINQLDGGKIIWEGREVHIANPKAAAAIGIEFVYQDLALCNNLDIVQNMFLGRERTSGPFLDDEAMEDLARETLAGLNVTTIRSIRQQVSSLSGGQRQSVAVAKAVMWNSKLVVLDEPTAALGVAQTAQVLALVRRLADRGLGVIIISHNLEDVLKVADSIAVLRLGVLVAQPRKDDVSSRELVELITTGRSGTRFPGTPIQSAAAHAAAAN
ncbi:MAG TPA: ATP-binding cassette domain-containing protein [Devosia sp.]|jgi:ABC-type sugar transport system ATPase subunit|nr:ATP-binding cassette domain-containing protein [Devosia sp.]